MLSLIIVSYALHGYGTISNTWEDPPASYLSRFVVLNCSVMLAVIQLFEHQSKLRLSLGLLGSFCLSWVGAICDSPVCKGNNTIHTFFATSFFICFDLKLFAPALVLLVWIEWTNVLVIMIGTYLVVKLKCKDVVWSLGEEPVGVDMVEAAYITVFTFSTTLIVSAGLGLWVGYLPQWWFISDMWTQIPGVWIGHWGVNLGVHFGWITLFGMHIAAKTKTRKRLIKVAMLALCGLVIVACVGSDENLVLHNVGGTLFFGGYDIFILGTLFTEEEGTLARTLRGCVAITAHVTRLLYPTHALAPGLEWLNAIAIMAFTLADVDVHADACAQVYDGIIRKEVLGLPKSCPIIY